MAASERQHLEEGPILDPVFIEHYWRVGRRPARLAAWWVARKMRKLGVPSTARVLDVGCGPGWLARFLAVRFPAMTFVAVDASEPMARRAHGGRGDRTRPPRVHYVVGQGERLPFAGGTFDLVMSGATLHHLADPVPLFDEVDRVLTDDGAVLISDLNRSTPRALWPLVLLANWVEKRLRPASARWLGEGIAPSFRAAFSPSEIRRFLADSRLGRRVRYYPRVFEHWIQTPARRHRRGPVDRTPAGE